MHTLEDFPAHSNFCELVLVSMGYDKVFVHVGDHVKVQAPSGEWVSPIVTGIYFSLPLQGLTALNMIQEPSDQMIFFILSLEVCIVTYHIRIRMINAKDQRPPITW